MTTNEIRQQLKNEALNKIIKIFNSFGTNRYSHHLTEDGSYAEQDYYRIKKIVQDLERELNRNKNHSLK